MGYTTYFNGGLNLNKKLTKEHHEFLNKLNETRRMARNVGPEYGVEGEFYVDGDGMMGQDREDNIIDFNRPPKTQPGLWCQWRPTEDGTRLEWDGGEKFYNYVEWLEYIIERILKPRGYVVNGKVDWNGEDPDDAGSIVVIDNVVSTRAQGGDGDNATRVFFVTDSTEDNEELFDCLEDAEEYIQATKFEGRPRIKICVVKNSYREENGNWNYEDRADTFKVISILKEYK